MKKIIAFIVVIFVLLTVPAFADGYEQTGCTVVINGEITDFTSIVHNNAHYVPMRKVFEKLGASVFFRKSDYCVLALAQNGDMIYHIIEDNAITVNGKKTVFENPSILENNDTYIPVEMISVIFWTDSISCDNQLLVIEKKYGSDVYTRAIREVLAVSKSSNFYPEKFKEYIDFHVQNPVYSMEDVITRVNLQLIYPFYENIATIEYPNELLVLVNKYNKLPENFYQYNLVNMREEHILKDGKEYLLEMGTYEKYIQMSDAAKRAGLSLIVVSAYRTEEYQRNLYNSKVKNSGKIYADNYSARPGHSEHQTGLAIDINSTSGTFENTPEFAWLQQHAHEYGFILRYPKGKEWITGYSYEPWHYRYVGTDVAKEIYEENLTYEEYYHRCTEINEFK